MKSSTLKHILYAATLLCMVSAALYFFTDRDSVAKSDTACTIDFGPCSQLAENGVTIELDILPKPVTAMSDLSFVVTIARNNAPISNAGVVLDLSMPGMFMGKNQPVLKQTAKGRYEGKGVITRCASGRKTWQANVTVLDNGKTATANFVFEVH